MNLFYHHSSSSEKYASSSSSWSPGGGAGARRAARHFSNAASDMNGGYTVRCSFFACVDGEGGACTYVGVGRNDILSTPAFYFYLFKR